MQSKNNLQDLQTPERYYLQAVKSGHYNLERLELGALGNFQVGVRSKGSDMPEDVHVSKINRISLNYPSGRRIRKRLNTMEFTIIKP